MVAIPAVNVQYTPYAVIIPVATSCGPYRFVGCVFLCSPYAALVLVAVTLDNLIDERGRELYWEGWRRNDLIRFGKFLNAWQEKAADAGSATLIFPVTAKELAANPNMVQNPGY